LSVSQILRYKVCPSPRTGHIAGVQGIVLSYTIIQNISLNLTLADIYDAETAIGIPQNDFQLKTTLGLKF
jgi:hypothetical protein